MVKIIELEEKADEEAALLENSPDTTVAPSGKRAAGHITSDITQLIKPRGIKNYRIKFFDVIRDSIAKHFQKLYDGNKTDQAKMLQGVDIVVDDLIVVSDELVPCFPGR